MSAAEVIAGTEIKWGVRTDIDAPPNDPSYIWMDSEAEAREYITDRPGRRLELVNQRVSAIATVDL